MRARLTIGVFILALAHGASAVHAQPFPRPAPRPTGQDEAAQKKLETLNQEIKQRKKRQEDLEAQRRARTRQAGKIRTRILKLSKLLREHDRALANANARLQQLTQSERAANAQLQSQRAVLARSLAGLQHMQRNPPPAFIVHPDDALDAIRGGMIMAGLVPTIQIRAATLGGRLEELRDLRAEIVRTQHALAERRESAKGDRAQLRALLARKKQEERVLRRQARTEARRVGELAKAARNLSDLMTELRKPPPSPRPSAPTQKTFRNSKGRLALPVEGKVLRAVRQGADAQLLRPGLTIGTYAGAQVTAPHGGQVLYAGIFRQYGNILILDVGGGYHMLLAGLGEMQSFVGQNVVAGEPLGQMPQARTRGDVRLYLEIRYRGKTVNPKTWVAAAR